MEVELSEKQIDLINNIAKKEGFVDFQIKTTAGSVKGDNYLGIITTVSIQNHHKKLELILKSALDSDELRKRAPIRKVFLREMFLYDTIFPEFAKLEKEEGAADGFSGYPKLYGTCKDDRGEVLVMENLKSVGYEMWNRKKAMTEELIVSVLREYGKLHAVSFALKEKKPELYRELTEDLGNVFAEMGSEEEQAAMLKSTLDNALNTVKGDRLATEALENFSLEANKFMMDDVRLFQENSVILHGDCWCNNILFKYEDTERRKPSKVCLIDWQISWTGSPILDLSYFMFTCATKEVFVDYKKYLQIYHDSLRASLKNLHCDADVVFPFATLEDHWQKFAKYGLFLSIMLLKLMLSDGEEVPNMAEIADSGKSFADGFNFEMTYSDTYNQRVGELVSVSAQNGWI